MMRKRSEWWREKSEGDNETQSLEE